MFKDLQVYNILKNLFDIYKLHKVKYMYCFEEVYTLNNDNYNYIILWLHW